jgi:D-alanyl-D-alanine carboxypeptidase
MRLWALGLVAVLAAGLPAQGQTVVTRTFTPDMSARVDRIGAAEVQNGRGAGIAIGIVEDGRLVYSRGFGLANIARRVRMQASTESYLGAVSEQFTAGAILLLVQGGKVKLDDKVTKYIPELTIAANVTIAELLTQSSGLPDYTQAPGVVNDPTRQIKVDDLLAAVNKMQLVATPGTLFANNDLNYILAGLIVGRVSGSTLSDYLQLHIFLPLVMDHTFYASDTGISPLHATGYTRGNAGIVPARAWDPTWLLGARGLVSNVFDLAKWDVDMPILLHVDAMRSMFTPGGAAGPTQYGMGWVIDRRGGKRFVWNKGEISGYHAMNAILPDDRIAVIVLANTDGLHGGPVTSPERVAGRILDLIAPPASVHLDNTILARATEWLQRLADGNIDRTELTPAFSAIMTDDLVAKSNFANLGKMQSIVPISSALQPNGDTLYEFLVEYPSDRYHYKFAVTPTGKIDLLLLQP